MTPNFIFLDPEGKRWRWIRLLLLTFFIIGFLVMIAFVRALFVHPYLQRSLWLSGLSKSLHSLVKSEVINYQSPKPSPSALFPNYPLPRNKFVPKNIDSLKENSQPIRLGFYTSYDPYSFSSLKDNADKLTHLCPEWFTMTGVPAELHEDPDPQVRELASENDLILMPLLANFNRNVWDPEAVETLARANSKKQTEFFSRLIEKLHQLDAGGVVIEWEEVDPAYRNQITNLIANFHKMLSQNGLELWLCIPADDNLRVFDLEQLSPVVDKFVGLVFDESGEEDEPGPIASQPWFEEWCKMLLEYGNPSQWIIALPTFGYDWKESNKAELISFADAMVRANWIEKAEVRVIPPLYAPNYQYTEGKTVHTVWFTDAITFHNQKVWLETQPIGGIAIYRLGLEDPQIWDTFNPHPHTSTFEHLNNSKESYLISQFGQGDFLYVVNESVEGKRKIAIEPNQFWTAEYLTYPKYPVVYQQGEASNQLVAFTFDDGPDPQWTPKVLDILKKNNIRATFFLIGENALAHPDLVKRIFKEGHTIGNHTFTHKDISAISTPRLIVELNATQRVIQSIIHRSTVLFRPPYNADRLPQSLKELAPLAIAQKEGYIPVSASIDSKDWEKPGAKIIFERVKEGRQWGNVLLFHDGGGDRSQTVAALPLIIDYLRRRGDKIVPLETLIGTSQASLMPPIPPCDPKKSRVIAQTGLYLFRFGVEFFWGFIIITTGIVFLRSIILVLLALKHHRREKKLVPRNLEKENEPPVSILIPAHNEEKVIRSTLCSILNTSYQGLLEVIVVDDGSTDKTAAIVREIAIQDPRVRLIQQPKMGKSIALDKAFQASSHNYLITLDADTQFQPDTISNLISQLLADPHAGAVCANIRVNNPLSRLVQFQALEYICGFNLDRRAYDVWNCITVAPGAGSAFRRQALEKAGGFMSDTLAEDTDLTLRIHRTRFRIRYAPSAIAWTEAPESISAFIRQRRRWAFGTLQCLWKHRDLFFHLSYPGLGFFSLPSIWFSQFFLVALAPIIDFILIASLFTGIKGVIFVYIFLFSLFDVLLALIACKLDKTPLSCSWRALPMRLFYRPLLSWVVWKAFHRALQGTWVSWGRSERKENIPPVFSKTSLEIKSALSNPTTPSIIKRKFL